MSSGIIAGNVQAMMVVDVTFDAANMTDTADVKEQTITVPGVVVTDRCFVAKQGHLDGIANGNAYVSAANTISVEFINPTGAAKNLGSMTYSVLVIRPDAVSGAFRS